MWSSHAHCVCLICWKEKSTYLYPVWVGNGSVISSGFRHCGIHMQCGFSVPELQKKALVEAWSFKGWVSATGKVGHLWAQWSVWQLSNLFWTFWRAQDVPSRSGQLCIIHLVSALENVWKCLGDQDCWRTRLQGSSAIVPELFMSKMNKWSPLLLYLWFLVSLQACLYPFSKS